LQFFRLYLPELFKKGKKMAMKEELKTGELMEAAREARRRLELEQEELKERAEQLKGFMTALETTEDVLQENERLEEEMEELRTQHQEEIEQLRQQHQEKTEQLRQQYQDEKDLLRQQLQDEKDRNTKLEMQLNEMSKMTASVAGKASHEELLKALRVFVNKSKRKKLEKRIAVKEMVLELANANSLMLPEDLSSTIDSLDDEQPLVEQSPASNSALPEDLSVLFTPEAQVLWQRLRDEGFIVADGYDLAEGVSANQAAYIADRMAEKLQIKKKWKLFQQLWGIPNLAQLAGTWQQTGKLPPRSSDIDKLMK
jgi:predicted RNase H-like nuclease (RuvC/YqgF family)